MGVFLAARGYGVVTGLTFFSTSVLVDTAGADVTAGFDRPCNPWMIGIHIRRHAECFSKLRHGHKGRAAGPSTHACFFIRQSLKLQFFVKGPLDTLIIAKIPFPLHKPNKGIENEARDDDEAAYDQDDDNAESREVHGIASGANLLIVAHHLRD